ncbi:MAG: hypothetical protein B7C24_03190 [Bacteroidetes bacterium 4572_77]|nr:MAG: hypothetical protein B7C24_03190 [Bacteroidetes bacterium 4572_77]
MQRVFYAIRNILLNNKGISLVFFALFFVFLIFASWQVKLSEDASRILPQSSQNEKLTEVLEHINFSERIYFHIYLEDSLLSNPQELILYAQELEQHLWQNNREEIKSIKLALPSNAIEEVSQYVWRNLPFLLDHDDYDLIEKQLRDSTFEKSFHKKYKTLMSPAAVFLKKMIIQDPVGLSLPVLQNLRSFQLDSTITLIDNHLFTPDKKHLLFYLEPNQSASETKKNSILIKNIEQSISEISENSKSKIKTEYFGATVVAVGNANQIKKDIKLTVGMAIGAVILLLLFFYKSKRLFALIFLPSGFAVLTSMAILYLLNKELSAIALGLGSVLVGISIDYVLHIFTHYQKNNSIKHVLNDVSEPILISAATTATAFFGLLVVSAPALQDMGVFAGMSIILSALYSLILIPVFLSKKKNKQTSSTQKNNLLIRFINQFSAYPFHQKKYWLLTILIISPVFFYYSFSVKFEGDMNTINYMSPQTQEAEKHLNKLTKLSQRNIFIVSQAKTTDQALQISEELQKSLQQLQDSGLILKYTSLQNILPSKSLQKIRLEKWKAFWTAEKIAKLQDQLQMITKKYGFKESTFQGAINDLTRDYPYINHKDVSLIKNSFLSEYLQQSPNNEMLISQIKTSSTNKTKVHNILKQNLDSSSLIIDKEYLTTQFVKDLKNDFQHLVSLTLLLVFLILLFSSGRIELALITFTPLLLSWVWTLGMMSIFHLSFNIVNIIITSFIFGLGVDYSIFITNGLTHKYKYGININKSYRTSIIISATTTLIGIGVLIFAQHPALKSMAAVTVIGLSSALLLSFTLQEFMFNWLVYKKDGSKRMVPISALNFVGSLTAIIIFALGSLLTTIAGFLLVGLPFIRSKKSKLLLHHFIRGFSWFMIFVMFNVKKNIRGWDLKKFQKPAIIISNHQSHIDIILMLMLHSKIIILTNDWVQNNFFYGKLVKWADFYPILDHLDDHIDKLRIKTKEGYSIMVFPEGTRSVSGKVARFHKGAFYLAQQLKLDILPILLHGPSDCITKGESYLKNGRIDVIIGDRKAYDDPEFGDNYVKQSKAYRKWYRAAYSSLHGKVVNPKYMRKRLELNYIYKGPILEWYGKIKMNFENNYLFFHQEIAKDALIVDLGCGYGFMDYQLLLLENNRRIIGIDYDENKIEVAKNCPAYTQFDKDQIQFEHQDLLKWDIPNADVFIIADVLHYINHKEQEWLIKQVVAKLNSGGKIIIREADSDMNRKHKGTQFSEWQSTKLIGFNKTKDQNKKLYFSAAKQRLQLLESLGLKARIADHTKLNSNTIIIAQT